MKFSNILKRKFSAVIWITVSWTLISMIQLGYEITILKEYGFEHRWSLQDDFVPYFLINTFAFVLNGFIGGLVVVFFLQYWIRNRSYGFGLLYGIIIYIILFFLMTCIQNYFVINSIWDGTTPFYAAYLKGLKEYFFSYEFIRIFPFWLFVMTGTLITLFINDKYGPGELKKFLLGKYFYPKSEERIFMFLDLKGSTSIAEKLGERKYFSFIQKVFKDVTPVLLDTEGEVYQYVGDEIVITWKIKNGIRNSNCIRCFQNIKKLLESMAPLYNEQFNAIPEFKAGVHTGKAIVGEVGVIKREIAYSGDVLNTTARIQSKCNELGASLLFSEDILLLFPEADFSFKFIESVKLRGKSETTKLYSLCIPKSS
ncbi:MAG: adenylate/guanylate cyclase domain-containing protein [Bacteroidetes bacterium]|nr:adenylate/guanylate cyclase domain-containing protein [Bacteroidota bacterium]